MIIKDLEGRKLIHPPRWLSTNTHYLTMMGSVAYGVSSDMSDIDIYGFCIPLKNDLFPHLRGEIPGFGKQIQRFEQWQEAHILDSSAGGGSGREYDFSVYSIVKYFQLCMDNNPNMIDSLFTPHNCVLYSSVTSNLVRDNRHLFLHKGCWPKFKGYAYAQLCKLNTKGRLAVRDFELRHHIPSTDHLRDRIDEVKAIISGDVADSIIEPLLAHDRGQSIAGTRLVDVYLDLLEDGDKNPDGKRKELVEKYGYDVKFAYHVVRLLLEVEQILATGTIDLQRDREQLKSIRRGEWSEKEIRDWASAKEADLETLYKNSELPWGPDESKIKALLLQCLEAHYGNLDGAVVQQDRPTEVLREIQKLLDTVQGRF